MFIADAHLDIAYNALKFNRHFWTPLAELREAERKNPSPNGIATLSGPEMLEAGIGLVFASIFLMPTHSPLNRYPHTGTNYADPFEAHEKGMNQLDFYQRLTDENENIDIIGNLTDLRSLIASHQSIDPEKPARLGIVPAFEGADPIREPEEVELWYEQGIRVVGLAWDDTRYAPGAWREGGGLTPDGYALLEAMADYNLIVDITHTSEKASLEALDAYAGYVVATHSSARSLLTDSERHLSDTQIQQLGERDGMIGIPLFNSFLRKGHRLGEAKERVTLDHVTAQIDYICQVLGDARHVGIGSDLDGGFGQRDIPAGMDSAADLPKIADALKERGYEAEDIAHIMGLNWVNLLQRAWEG